MSLSKIVWQTRKLGEVANIFNGNSINENEKKEKYLGLKSGTPYISTKDIEFDNKIDFENGVLIPKDQAHKFKIVEANSVLICAEGGSAGRKFAHTNRNIFFGNKLFALTSNNKIDSKFVFYFYQSEEFCSLFRSKMSGLIGGVSINKFKEIEIPLPPIDEQKRIVKILDEVFDSVAKVKETTEKNLKNAREVFESYLQSVFVKNEGWLEKQLDQIGEIQTGSTPKTSEKENFGKFIPFIKPADFNKDGSLNYENDGLSEIGLGKSRLIEKDSVMMVCIGATIGKCGFCDRDVTANQQINSIKPSKSVLHKLIYYQMLTEDFQSRVIFRCNGSNLI